MIHSTYIHTKKNNNLTKHTCLPFAGFIMSDKRGEKLCLSACLMCATRNIRHECKCVLTKQAKQHEYCHS